MMLDVDVFCFTTLKRAKNGGLDRSGLNNKRDLRRIAPGGLFLFAVSGIFLSEKFKFLRTYKPNPRTAWPILSS